MRKLITMWLLLISSLSFGQAWQGGLGNALQRQPTDSGYNHQFILGTGKGVLKVRTLQQGDSVVNSKFPKSQRGQVFKAVANGSRQYAPAEPLIYGLFVYNDAQLTRAFNAGASTQLQIFNSFKRFAHGGNVNAPNGNLNPSDTIPLIPIQTNSYSYDTTNNVVFSLTNTSAHTGFVSKEKFTKYVHQATLTATGVGSPTTGQAGLNNGYDNDIVAIVIAFVEDSTHMVKNNAFGLSPGDFTWPIDVTSAMIPDQHTLTLIRNRNGTLNAYVIYYDYGKLTQALIANGTSVVQTTAANWQGAEVDTKVILNGDTVTTMTTNFSDTPGGKGTLGHPLTVLLTSNALLEKFRHGVSYGYSTQSQANASFKNIYFSGSTNIVYDIRNGDTYQFRNTGYVLDTTKNMFNDLGTRFFWRNKVEGTYGYILPDNTFDVLIGETP